MGKKYNSIFLLYIVTYTECVVKANAYFKDEVLFHRNSGGILVENKSVYLSAAISSFSAENIKTQSTLSECDGFPKWGKIGNYKTLANKSQLVYHMPLCCQATPGWVTSMQISLYFGSLKSISEKCQVVFLVGGGGLDRKGRRLCLILEKQPVCIYQKQIF